jgi:uncharacterized protein YgbK (DUF1537 family)
MLMTTNRITLAQMWSQLPAEWPDDPRAEIQCELQRLNQKVVVLDDDPTGTQTVHDIPVLTDWSVPFLAEELSNDLSCFYILTNSRSMPQREACDLNRQIGENLCEAGLRAGRKFVTISRSDSTLRGHFPAEVESLREGLGFKPDATFLVPFFLEGGRYTIGDVHYVATGEWLIGAGETQFARDAAFGYRASNLREWVEEKTGARVHAADVASVSLKDIRLGGPDRVRACLMALHSGAVCVINCASTRDLEVFTLGLLRAEAAGKRFLYRTAASIVPVRCGMAPKPLLSLCDFVLDGRGGLIVAGSYVPQTTSQLEMLFKNTEAKGIEMDVGSLVDESRRPEVIRKVAEEAARLLEQDKDVALFTSRKLIAQGSHTESLLAGQRISSAIVEIVRSIRVRPRYILAKGGITSSDIAGKALNVRRAVIRGQILPGVPVWELGPETAYPGVPYIVFPGNVGDANAVAKVASLFSSCSTVLH